MSWRAAALLSQGIKIGDEVLHLFRDRYAKDGIRPGLLQLEPDALALPGGRLPEASVS